jgi:uridine phosphorylase
MGGPSAAIVLHELIELGARRAVRVGTCGALAPTLALGELVVARESICADGASRALGAGERASADAALTEALTRAAPGIATGTVVSVDLFYEDPARARRDDAIAVEMEAATLFALGAAASVPVACVLCVSDTFDRDGARARIDAGALRTSVERMGALALTALAPRV